MSPISIRIMAAHEAIQGVSEQLVDLLEGAGYEIIEWSQPRRSRPPQESLSRVYLVCVEREIKEVEA